MHPSVACKPMQLYNKSFEPSLWDFTLKQGEPERVRRLEMNELSAQKETLCSETTALCWLLVLSHLPL